MGNTLQLGLFSKALHDELNGLTLHHLIALPKKEIVRYCARFFTPNSIAWSARNATSLSNDLEHPRLPFFPPAPFQPHPIEFNKLRMHLDLRNLG